VRYRDVFRTDPPKAFGPDLLRRSIAHRIAHKSCDHERSESGVRHRGRACSQLALGVFGWPFLTELKIEPSLPSAKRVIAQAEPNPESRRSRDAVCHHHFIVKAN
jgi:hypothetical protein